MDDVLERSSLHPELHEHVVEAGFTCDACVGHRVERHPSGEAEVPSTRLLAHLLGEGDDYPSNSRRRRCYRVVVGDCVRKIGELIAARFGEER